MDSKHYTQVLIDGKVYTLGGSEDEGYLQRVASYVNEKMGAMRKLPGFTKQNNEYQTAMIALNIADDYFKSQEQEALYRDQRDEMERETYSLKHELVSTQMKLEAVLKDLEERQNQLESLGKEKGKLERRLREMEKSRSSGEQDSNVVEVKFSREEKVDVKERIGEESSGAKETAAAQEPQAEEKKETVSDTRQEEEKKQELTRRAIHAAMEARVAGHKKH